jgi:RNA polymerase sigma factor (sigma-70 family)
MKQDQPTPGARLDQIPTEWSLLRLAHVDALSQAGPAREALVLRYNRAIRNYVRSLIHNDHDADEVAQEVLFRLVRGQFAGATPERGSFRRLLIVSTHNLVRSFWSRQRRQAGSPVELDTLADEPGTSRSEQEALSTWRQALLDLAWKALEQFEKTTPGSISYTLLRLRGEHPNDDIPQLAERLSRAIGRTLRPEAVRQQLRRARLRFAEGLLEEVARGLSNPTPELVEEELIECGLMPYVQDLLPPDWRTTGCMIPE